MCSYSGWWLRGHGKKRFLFLCSAALPPVLAALEFTLSSVNLTYLSNKEEDLFGFYLVSEISAQNHQMSAEAASAKPDNPKRQNFSIIHIRVLTWGAADYLNINAFYL